MSVVMRRTNKCVIASAGCQVDMAALQKLLQARNVMFQHNHGKPMSCKATAQLLSNTLYYKRFFPYYTFNLCAGLDEEGEGLRAEAGAGGTAWETLFAALTWHELLAVACWPVLSRGMPANDCVLNTAALCLPVCVPACLSVCMLLTLLLLLRAWCCVHV